MTHSPAPTASLSHVPPLARAMLLLAATLTIMAGTIIAPSLPAMTAHFQGTPAADVLTRLTIALPALVIALASPIAGRLVDGWGRRPLLLGGMALYAVAGTAGYFVDDLTLLLVSRAVLGLAVAAIMTANTTLIADLFRGAARNRFLGLQGAFTNLGGVVFLLLGGFLADLGWRLPFLIYLVPVLMFPFMWRSLPTGTPHPHGGTRERTPLPWGTLAPVYAVAFVGMLTFFTMPTQLPFHLAQTFRANAGVSGTILAFSSLLGMAAALLYPRLRARATAPQVALLALVLLGAGMLLVGVAPSYALLLPGVALVGLGNGVSWPNFTSWVTTVASPAVRGQAVGLLSSSLFLGQFMSPLLSQPLAQATSLGTMYLGTGALLIVAAALLYATVLRPAAAKTGRVQQADPMS